MRISFSLLWSLKDLGTAEEQQQVAMILHQWKDADTRREKVECTYQSSTNLLSIRIGQGPVRHHTISGICRNIAVVGAVGSVPPPRTTTLRDLPIIPRTDAITVRNLPAIRHTTSSGMQALPPPPEAMIRRLSGAITKPEFHLPKFMVSPGYHSHVWDSEEE